jgi:DNA-binding NarL/FixJ family response regulator
MRSRLLIGVRECLVREGLVRLLEDDFDVVASVADMDGLRVEARRLLPDAVVAGLDMLLDGGPAAVRELRAAAPGVRVVVVAPEGREPAASALSRELAGWVNRSSTPGELRQAVRAALSGPRLPSSAVTAGAATQPHPHVAPTDVSPRAREVLRLLAEGKLMKQVAADLGITPRTVAFHKYKAMRTLGLDSNAALVRYAVRSQIV